VEALPAPAIPQLDISDEEPSADDEQDDEDEGPSAPQSESDSESQ